MKSLSIAKDILQELREIKDLLHHFKKRERSEKRESSSNGGRRDERVGHRKKPSNKGENSKNQEKKRE